ncbi:MAG: phosphatase PAP2 family protein [Hyphomonadaceae bacterium]|nr:phosphatase PAP2 family protein [Hyphomonadaceae bacterium]
MLKHLVAAAALFTAFPASAQTQPLIDGPALAGPPPAPGSPLAAADRLSMRPAVSEERLAQARVDLAFDAFAIFRPVLGEDFTPERFPHTVALLTATAQSVNAAIGATKRAYERERPHVEDPSLLRCDDPDNPSTNDSYPTGHGAGGWALALVLAELIPARADAILQRGRDFGESRIICGYHFPSDVDASRLVAAGGVARLHGEASFRRQLEAARRELARAYRE